MRIYVIDRRRGHSSVFQRPLNRLARPVAGWVGVCDSIAAQRIAVACEFGINSRPARLGCFPVLEHQKTRPLSQDEAVARCIKGATGPRGLVIIGGQRPKQAER